VAAVRRSPLAPLVAGMIAIAAALALASWVFAGKLGEQADELAAARAEVESLKGRLVVVESERDGLRERVAALEAALIAAGVDPSTIAIEPSSSTAPGPSSTTDAERQASSAPAGRETSSPRPAETDPDSQPSPQPQPSGNPENPPPPQDPPPEEEPCPVPELPVVGCPV
jgi:hypothetical protein